MPKEVICLPGILDRLAGGSVIFTNLLNKGGSHSVHLTQRSSIFSCKIEIAFVSTGKPSHIPQLFLRSHNDSFIGQLNIYFRWAIFYFFHYL